MDREDLARRMSVCAERIERVIDNLLGSESLTGEIDRPAQLLAAMRYAAMGGGKRLRPFLTVECARALGVDDEGVWRVAAAIELIHCYSLVHDDLPAMDDDDLRRGRPTVHKAFDEATAILTGDALLTYAFDVMAGPQTHSDPGVRAELVIGLARSSGLGGMAGGQALDLEAEKSRIPLGLDATKRLQAMKTGALLAFAVDAATIFAQSPPGLAQAFAQYGRALGAAFQIADDLLDAEGDELAVGKRIGKDAERNKATFVAVLGLDGARKACGDLVREACEALRRTGLGDKTEVLELTAKFVAERRS